RDKLVTGVQTCALPICQEETGVLDIPGFVLSAGGLAAVVYALSQVGPRGFGDSRVTGFGLAGLLAFAAFIAVELRTPRPLIDVQIGRASCRERVGVAVG